MWGTITDCALLLLLLPLLARAAIDEQTLPGPASPAEQAAWLSNLTAWRATTRAAVNYSGVIYDDARLTWAAGIRVAPQVHTFDRLLYDTSTARFTVGRFVADLESRYGRVDAVSLWHSYPNLGVDDRSQFDLTDDLPGGLDALKSVVEEFNALGIRVGLPFNPWDTGTAPDPHNASDYERLAQLGVTLGLDFLNGDTMGLMPFALFNATLAAGRPLALQPEGGPSLEGLSWTVMGWGEGWIHAPSWRAPFIPAVDLFKWIERRHATQIVDRWSERRIDDLQMVHFNGLGYVAWENVWGIFNTISYRDGEALRRVAAMLRFLAPFLSSEEWEPHAPVSADAAALGVFASKWPAPAGSAFAGNATAWTVVNRGTTTSSGPLLVVPCGGDSAFFDLYAGVEVLPEPATGGGCVLSVPIEGSDFGAVLAVARADAAGNSTLAAFLAAMANLTAVPLSVLNSTVAPLQQVMTEWGVTARASTAPPGMVLIPGNASWLFAVNSTIIETNDRYACDVQFPFEPVATVTHKAVLQLPPLFMDVTPVTNELYARFLTSSSYAPAHSQGFLRDWTTNGTYPAGWEDRPVTWIDLLDASAFCSFYGKRLPNDYEWQHAAQGDDARQYPWGNVFDDAHVPPVHEGRTRGPLANVGRFPSGASPYGVMDMTGLVFQWTNEFVDTHTRAAIVRGGARNWAPQGSDWYFPNDLTASGSVRVSTHNKLLLMAPSYDRHGTVGFRCVQDAA